MPITSTILEDRPQIDGRRAVREQHADAFGHSSVVEYLAEADTDAAAMLAIHAEQAAAQFVAAETQALIDFVKAGNDPRGFAFQNVEPSAGFVAVLEYFTACPSVEAFDFATVVMGFDIAGLTQYLPINEVTAQKVLDWSDALTAAKDSADIAASIRDEIAAEAGI